MQGTALVVLLGSVLLMVLRIMEQQPSRTLEPRVQKLLNVGDLKSSW